MGTEGDTDGGEPGITETTEHPVATALIDIDGDGVADGIVTETTLTDVDGDGSAPDIVEVVTTTMIDVDGDGVPDIVSVNDTVGIDFDGDGTIDAIQSTEVTGVDLDGDGTIDEIEVTEATARPTTSDADLSSDPTRIGPGSGRDRASDRAGANDPAERSRRGRSCQDRGRTGDSLSVDSPGDSSVDASRSRRSDAEFMQ